MDSYLNTEMSLVRATTCLLYEISLETTRDSYYINYQGDSFHMVLVWRFIDKLRLADYAIRSGGYGEQA